MVTMYKHKNTNRTDENLNDPTSHTPKATSDLIGVSESKASENNGERPKEKWLPKNGLRQAWSCQGGEWKIWDWTWTRIWTLCKKGTAVQNEKNQNGTHTIFVSNVDLNENPTESRTIPITSRGATDYSRIINTKLAEFLKEWEIRDGFVEMLRIPNYYLLKNSLNQTVFVIYILNQYL